MTKPYDVVIAGGGPAGLSAALVLGRARKRVLLCDAGTPRNAKAEHMNGFVSRDGIPPTEVRAVSREQLRQYDSVELRAAAVLGARGDVGAFTVALEHDEVTARRVIVTGGMIDELPDDIPGYRELWGRGVVQCPYCHAWEHRDRPVGMLVASAVWLEFALMVRGWSRDVVLYTGGAFEVPADVRARLTTGGVRIEERPIAALHGEQGTLRAVELADGTRVPCELLFARPPQHQRRLALVLALGLALDEQGFVQVDEQQRSSVPGIYAA
ncbi:MAG: NAD(P)/FAD-dependent oxidoreductase, partial [Deltaproteobacteria bacterium]|nr:NAD(P)/FAD-dependent oxidoreductase [Nannocystaceae bacterium]